MWAFVADDLGTFKQLVDDVVHDIDEELGMLLKPRPYPSLF